MTDVLSGKRDASEWREKMGYQDITFEKGPVLVVTGGAGFIGSNLCEALLDMG